MNRLENEIIVCIIYDGYQFIVDVVEQVIKAIQSVLESQVVPLEIFKYMHMLAFREEIWADPTVQSFISNFKQVW